MIKKIKPYEATIFLNYRQQELKSTECCNATSSGTMNGAGPLVQLTTRPLWPGRSNTQMSTWILNLLWPAKHKRENETENPSHEITSHKCYMSFREAAYLGLCWSMSWVSAVASLTAPLPFHQLWTHPDLATDACIEIFSSLIFFHIDST